MPGNTDSNQEFPFEIVNTSVYTLEAFTHTGVDAIHILLVLVPRYEMIETLANLTCVLANIPDIRFDFSNGISGLLIHGLKPADNLIGSLFVMFVCVANEADRHADGREYQNKQLKVELVVIEQFHHGYTPNLKIWMRWSGVQFGPNE